ncbi:MAG: hypothetical protein HC807_01275, partial [Gammaproteobacteria bacterium]|nr:hypothetical protein [Gammaproteobacteria bacterium]
MLAITTFTAKDATEKKNIAAALKAEYGVVQASAAMKSKREATLGSTSMEVSYMQVGGGSGILPTTRDKLVEKLESIAIEAARNPKFHSMEVTPYDQLASWPGDAIPAEDPEADDVISNHYWALTSLNDDIQSILDDPGAYWTMTGLGIAELRHLQDEVNRLRSDIYQGARLGRIGAPASTFRFQSKPLAALNAPASAGAGPAWAKAAFAAKLQASAPQKNVNALRLNLPLPLSAAASL